MTSAKSAASAARRDATSACVVDSRAGGAAAAWSGRRRCARRDDVADGRGRPLSNPSNQAMAAPRRCVRDVGPGARQAAVATAPRVASGERPRGSPWQALDGFLDRFAQPALRGSRSWRRCQSMPTSIRGRSKGTGDDQAVGEYAGRDEAARQHRQQVRVVDDARRGRELADGEDDASAALELCERLVDEAARPAGEADADVLGRAVGVERERRKRRELVLTAHRADVLAGVERLERRGRARTLGGERRADLGKEADGEVGAAVGEQRPDRARRAEGRANRCARAGRPARGSGRHKHGRRASAIASEKLRSSRVGSKPCGSNAWRRLSRATRISGHSASAWAVGRTPPGTVTKRSSPVASRSRRRALLTAGWVIASCAAARVTLRSTITAPKTRSRLRSRVRKFTVAARAEAGPEWHSWR